MKISPQCSRIAFGPRAVCLLSLVMALVPCFGCQPSGPGLEDKPPPKGGPPASSDKPPGAVNNPNLR